MMTTQVPFLHVGAQTTVTPHVQGTRSQATRIAAKVILDRPVWPVLRRLPLLLDVAPLAFSSRVI